MKIRFSFALKILLPYLLVASLFFVVFYRVRQSGDLMVILVSGSGLIVSILLGVIHVYWLKRPLYRVRRVVNQLTLGKLPVFPPSGSTDEIGDLERNLVKLVENLRSLTRFARSLASGDFKGSYEKLSADDEMGEALLTLKGSLMASLKESESRRREEENRTWTANGLAKFSKLFREAEDDLQVLSREVMRELVAYTEADVGALFITSDTGNEKPVLKLTGSYAFDREKIINQSYEFGEGLVGRAAMERDIIYMNDLPPGYLKIRSGLGEEVPSSLLLIPVILDRNVLGVIELASLGEIPAFQAAFIQQLADALASTISKVKANLMNRELLEQSRKQAEEPG
ncbi:MAG: GAF domain-containing protein [Bacteroidales bacterium]